MQRGADTRRGWPRTAARDRVSAVGVAIACVAACAGCLELVGAASDHSRAERRKREQAYRDKAEASRDRMPPRTNWWCEPGPRGVDCRVRAIDAGVFCGNVTVTCGERRHLARTQCFGALQPGQVGRRTLRSFSPPLKSTAHCSRVSYRPLSTADLRAEHVVTRARERARAEEQRRLRAAQLARSPEFQRLRSVVESVNQAPNLRAVIQGDTLVIIDAGPSLCTDLSWVSHLRNNADIFARAGVTKGRCLGGAVVQWQGDLRVLPQTPSDTLCGGAVAAWRQETDLAKKTLRFEDMPASCRRLLERGGAGE